MSDATTIIKAIEKKHLKATIPDFRAGDTVKVWVKIKEGEKERVQAFEGVCIKKTRGVVRASFTVRKISYGVGVERVPRVWLRDLLTAVQRGPRVLICDVEGAEAGILERDAAALQAFSLVIVELHQSTFAGKRVDVGGLVAQFEGIGFEVAASHGPVRVFRARARAAAPA